MILSIHMTMSSDEWSLRRAAKDGSLEDVQRYLTSGVNVNCQDEDGRTPLYEASKQGHNEVVKLLLKYNADPNFNSYRYDKTPLHVAGNEVIAECLINSGANINTLDKWGWTPLWEASNNDQTEVVKLLLKYNADPNISDNYGVTPLHVAGSEVTAECLINGGANTNTLDKDLNTTLHRACVKGHIDIVQCLVENGANVKARNKDNQTPIDILKKPHDKDIKITGRRRDCLEWLDQMGYLEDTISAVVPIADLSTEISSSSPSIDKMDSYGLRLDVDPSSLPSEGSPILADIKVFTVDDDDEVSTPSFTFPEETKPVSAVYTISISDTHVPVRTLRIRHCADPNNPEELEQLMFVKSSDDSSSKLEVVPGGIFKPGEQYGEMTPTQHVSSWGYSIARRIKKLFSKKAQYVGMVLYRNVKQFHVCWLMDFIVRKNNPKTMMALNEYIISKCGHDVVKEPEFIFTFKESDRPKLGLATGKDERVLKCSNGWEISLDMYEISQDTVDHFKRSTDVPGRCSLKIHTHMNVCHELALLPTVTLNGIISDKKHIQINPPIPDSVAEFEQDYTNIRPLLKSKGEVPTLEAVFDLMKRYSAKWNEFARAVRISQNARQILYDERISAEARLERVIYQWIESECSPVTWNHLIDVLRRMGLQDVIDVIKAQSESACPPDPDPFVTVESCKPDLDPIVITKESTKLTPPIPDPIVYEAKSKSPDPIVTESSKPTPFDSDPIVTTEAWSKSTPPDPDSIVTTKWAIKSTPLDSDPIVTTETGSKSIPPDPDPIVTESSKPTPPDPDPIVTMNGSTKSTPPIPDPVTEARSKSTPPAPDPTVTESCKPTPPPKPHPRAAVRSTLGLQHIKKASTLKQSSSSVNRPKTGINISPTRQLKKTEVMISTYQDLKPFIKMSVKHMEHIYEEHTRRGEDPSAALMAALPKDQDFN